MNILWESWLKSFTVTESEAIVSRAQGKEVSDYRELMSESLREAYRVLRPDHWMVLVFMNSSERVWQALHDAIKQSGFIIEKINIFDKQHGTFKQFVSNNTAGADLMIHCRKATNAAPGKHSKPRAFESVRDFISQQNERIPVLPFLHVQRDAEIDYRTLYSRYISLAMQRDRSIMDFAQFRTEASEAINKKR